jgi:hypothetical protein
MKVDVEFIKGDSQQQREDDYKRAYSNKEEEQMVNSKFRFGILEDLDLSSRGAMRRSSCFCQCRSMM